MSILINKSSNVIVQGMTGKEGSKQTKEMVAYGTNVVAGVVPGKSGEKLDGIPVYGSVDEAKKVHRNIDVSVIVVPAKFVEKAATEAIEANIHLVVIFTEGVTVQSCARIIAKARKAKVRVIGPSSVGILVPDIAKVGGIGGGESKTAFASGNIGVISKSGGMTAEISNTLTREDLGQSTAIGIGGDQIIGSDYKDLLELFLADNDTKAIVLFCEVGGTYEEQAAEYLKKVKYPKPVFAIVAGKFSETLVPGAILGHGGAIVSKGQGSYTSKIAALTSADVTVVETLDELPKAVKTRLSES